VHVEAGELRQSSTELCRVDITPTGRWDAFETFVCEFSNSSRDHLRPSIHLVLSVGGDNVGIDWILFE